MSSHSTGRLTTLFHRTAASAAVLSDGFRDATGKYLTETERTGVWLRDVPLDESEGTEGNELLAVTIDEQLISQYEWVDESGEATYREWLVPASVINMKGVVRLLTEDEADAHTVARWDQRLTTPDE